MPLLPLTSVHDVIADLRSDAGTRPAPPRRPKTRCCLSPTPETVLDTLLPSLYQPRNLPAGLDAKASEHSARMVAMKTAKDNATKLLGDLTLEYNKARQAGDHAGNSRDRRRAVRRHLSNHPSCPSQPPLIANEHRQNRPESSAPSLTCSSARTPSRHLPGAHRRLHRRGVKQHAHPRGPAAPRRRRGPRHRDVLLRRPRAGYDRGLDTGAPISVPVGEGVLGRIFDVTGKIVDGQGEVKFDKKLSDSPPAPGARGAGHQGADPRDRHQGHRSHLPLHQGRQGRSVRRCRRRQDRRHSSN
jgi:hypothetical protein